MITLTERASKEIQKIQKDKHLPAESGLRVAIKGGGCSGFEYFLDLSKHPAEGDKIFESQGISIFIDPKSLLYLIDTTIDFEENLSKRGFVFNNPNAKGTCGCGSSFAV